MNPSDAVFTVLELNHVALHVRDLDASVRFYGSVLGLPQLPRPDFGFDGAWFGLGAQELHLIVTDDEHGLPTGHFALRVADPYVASRTLRERGLRDLHGPAPRPDGAIQVFLRDPDGHQIEMVSFGPSETG